MLISSPSREGDRGASDMFVWRCQSKRKKEKMTEKGKNIIRPSGGGGGGFVLCKSTRTRRNIRASPRGAQCTVCETRACPPRVAGSIPRRPARGAGRGWSPPRWKRLSQRLCERLHKGAACLYRPWCCGDVLSMRHRRTEGVGGFWAKCVVCGGNSEWNHET